MKVNNKPIRTKLRFILHAILPGTLRQRIYTIPYAIYIRKFMRKVDINSVPLFSYIEIETINRCNGKCSFCPVNVNQQQRPYAKMEEKLFKKIVSELEALDYSGEIHLFCNNEPFLDERIIDFAKYTREHVVNAYISIYTNGSLLTIDKAKEICKYLDIMVIDNYSVDGEMPSSLKEIYELCGIDSELQRCIQFDQRNPDEVLSSRGGQAPNKKDVSLFGVSRGCIYPYRQMVIRPDGKCSLCCNDALGKYTLGDANYNSLSEIWHSSEYRRIRLEMKENGRKKINLCRKCDTHYFDRT